MRWTEQLAIVGAEFGRAVRHYDRMQEIWSLLAKECLKRGNDDEQRVEEARAAFRAEGLAETSEPVEEKKEVWFARGAGAYARKKATFYKDLAQQTRALMDTASVTCDVEGDWASFDGT